MTYQHGFYPGIPDAEYHALPQFSVHDLLEVEDAPQRYVDAKENPEPPTEGMRFGTLTHLAVLELDKFQHEVVVGPNAKRNTTAGKMKWAAFEAKHLGKEIVTAQEMADLMGMRAAVYADRAARALLYAEGETELPMFWRFPWCSLESRARIDRAAKINGKRIIIDVKTAKSARMEDFACDAIDRGYDAQAAYYTDGYADLTGEYADFIFVVVEKKPPYMVAVYRAPEAMMARGRKRYIAAMRTAEECTRSGIWPGYGGIIRDLELPGWALRKS